MSVQELATGTFRDLAEVESAIGAAQQRLFDIQHADGHWCGELEGDTILESEYLLLLYFLGRTDANRVRKACEYLRRKQLPDGGWAIYEGGPNDVSSSVKAYFVLKLFGEDVNAPHMERARRIILNLGGIEACNSFTKIYLSIFGQYDWNRCPAVPPELILFPDWFVFNIYQMSYWSRAIVVPLSIIWANKPVCAVPDDKGIDELQLRASHLQGAHVARPARERFWRAFFTVVDQAAKVVEKVPFHPLRRRAIKRAEAWILEHLDASGGLGAIFPPIINTIFAFRCLGRPADDPLITDQLEQLHRLEIEEDETLRLQPCFSAIWDTALGIHCLRASGVPADDSRILDAARWLLGKQTSTLGDWKKKNPAGEPGGWYFQYDNEFYPDTDDTSEVLLALAAVRFPDAGEERGRVESIDRAVKWQLSMQNDDGGWGAFDKGCDNEVFTFIPFADHNAMIDPSCEDITGRTVEAFKLLGFDRSHAAMQNAIGYLHRKQTPAGTWYGRWGCNYIYGTWLAARGLAVAGEPIADERLQRVVRWFAERQNEDGGWGELQSSYDDPSLMGVGPSTPSQTAWALLTLIELGETSSPAVRRGIDYLLERQRDDGSWFDETWTATGFPRVFYLRYHLYATYFPLWALAAYQESVLSTECFEKPRIERVQPTR
jgi:squalene-hopene/tetraprenyl-beta-curcumene cyclase